VIAQPVPGGRWLAPLGGLYGLAAAARVAAYRSGVLPRARLAGPVISVGNLSVGGTGKTPVVAWVATVLRDAGEPVAILSRGYGGRFAGGALVVADEDGVHATAEEAGDEPVMLARRLPGVVVAVGRRRDEVGRVVEARFGRRTHVLDDGFQHLRLHRDLDLLCVDAASDDSRPLPAGRLREFPSAAGRADLVLLTQADRVPPERLEALARRHGPERTLSVGRELAGFADLEDAETPPPRRAFALSGVAAPERFEADLAGQVAEVVGQRRFGDHHAFTREEVEACAEEARQLGADAIVTTEKDAARLRQLPLPAGPPFAVLRLLAAVHDAGKLKQRLLGVARGEPAA
jgi:tetraacyldisaccharide 4'-kinase